MYTQCGLSNPTTERCKSPPKILHKDLYESPKVYLTFLHTLAWWVFVFVFFTDSRDGLTRSSSRSSTSERHQGDQDHRHNSGCLLHFICSCYLSSMQCWVNKPKTWPTPGLHSLPGTPCFSPARWTRSSTIFEPTDFAPLSSCSSTIRLGQAISKRRQAAGIKEGGKDTLTGLWVETKEIIVVNVETG